MDVHFFFEGSGSREEASSAFLATLLEQDAAFRGAFLTRAARDFGISGSPVPTVSVEHTLGAGSIDVLLEYAAAVILVENKISPGAKRDGQLLEYYRGAIAKWPGRRLAAVFLAPSTALGRSEIEDVRREIRRRRRGGPTGDVAVAIGWSTVHTLVNRWCREDPAFARDGMRAVRGAIKAASARVYINWSGDAFLSAAREKPPAVGAVIGWVLDWLQRIDPQVVIGNGRTGPLYITVRSAVDDRHKIGQVGLDGWVNVSYAELRRVAPFDDPGFLVALIRRLNAIPGMKARRIEEDFFEHDGSSWIPPTILGQPEAMSAFLETLDWIRETLAET